MAYNSDGYIMIDFSMVDFRKTNQTIDGLFERCKNVIGTNKFVIVINANNKTPLPSTVSITNGQYVIESVLYTFSISSADNLHITKKTTPEELIDDDHITLKTTFSSSKIQTLFDSLIIKSFTYIGNGQTTRTIKFPEIPKYFKIYKFEGGQNVSTTLGIWNKSTWITTIQSGTTSGAGSQVRNCGVTYNNDEITLDGGAYSIVAMNDANLVYTVYYI